MRISREGNTTNANNKSNGIIINSLLGSLIIAICDIHKSFQFYEYVTEYTFID